MEAVIGLQPADVAIVNGSNIDAKTHAKTIVLITANLIKGNETIPRFVFILKFYNSLNSEFLNQKFNSNFLIFQLVSL